MVYPEKRVDFVNAISPNHFKTQRRMQENITAKIRREQLRQENGVSILF